MLIQFHVREVIDIDVPDYIALDTVACSRLRENRWCMNRGWHEDGNDLDRFINSALREALQARMRMRQTKNAHGLMLNGWVARPDLPKDMP